MKQNPGIEIMHEPFTDCYYFGELRRSSRYGDFSAGARTHHVQLCRLIVAPRRAVTRFVKELAFQALPFIDDRLLANVRHAFLLNRPDFVYASLIRIKPDFTEDEFGYTALHAMHKRVRAVTGVRAPVFTTRDLRDEPESVLRPLCTMADIPFSDHMLHWEPGPVRTWKWHERESQSRFHRSTERSGGILPHRERTHPVVVDSRACPIVSDAWSIYDSLTASEASDTHRHTAGE